MGNVFFIDRVHAELRTQGVFKVCLDKGPVVRLLLSAHKDKVKDKGSRKNSQSEYPAFKDQKQGRD